MSYGYGDNYGYDQINVGASDFVDLSEQPISMLDRISDVNDIKKTERLLEKKMYSLSKNDLNRGVGVFNNGSNYRSHEDQLNSFNNNRGGVTDLVEEAARNDIKRNIENHYYGGADLYRDNYFGVSGVPPAPLNHFGASAPSFKHSEKCFCDSCKKDLELEKLNESKEMKKFIENLQKRNDYLLMFLVILVIIICVKFSSTKSPASILTGAPAETPPSAPTAPPATPASLAPSAPPQ